MIRASADDRAATEGGFSLIELLVTLALFSVLLLIFISSTSIMFKDVRHQIGQSDNLDASRRVIAELDLRVRYANAINTPGQTTDVTGSTTWVEWQTGYVGQAQTCYQWRLQPTGDMQYRTWPVPATPAAFTGATGWNTRASHIVPTIGSAPPATLAVFDFPPGDVRATTTRQELVVQFTTTYGVPPVRTLSAITITAQNTTSSAVLLSKVCTEMSRS